MSITLSFAAVADAQELVCDLLESSFKLNKADALEAYKELSFHFTRLKESCWLVAETPYVDKVHRDSYYHYYSSKHSSCIRDSARISIFEGEVKIEDFRNQEKEELLKKNYRGFIILRPTEPFFMGRTVISPAALKVGGVQICTTVFDATVCGIKFQVRGFPHASQDTETMTCAETTLWAMMEYFSTRYAEYRPVLPSRIINTLNKVSVERQVPSKGLSIPQISYALREFGFGTKIYAREDFSIDFERIISCYIESGIPVVIAVDNHDEKGNIGHAMLCVGHERNNNTQLSALAESTFDNDSKNLTDAIQAKKISLFDYDDVKKNFIFIDDNKPAYSSATLEKPCQGYWQPDWQKCKAKFLIVPLYKRIHLEAYEAKKFIINFLLIGPYPVNENQEILLRVFLASSRSYKDRLAHNDSFSTDLKEKIIGSALPKFIWVGELSTKGLMQQNKAKGVVLLDATEANTEMNKPLILAAFDGNIIEPDIALGELVRKPLPLAGFMNYENNLTEAY